SGPLVAFRRVETRHQELEAQGVAVVRPRSERVGKRLEQVVALLVAQLRPRPLALRHDTSPMDSRRLSADHLTSLSALWQLQLIENMASRRTIAWLTARRGNRATPCRGR